MENILIHDLKIPRSPKGRHLIDIVQRADSLPHVPLVYTAFDGDQELLCGAMRAAVLRLGKIPVNPPSLLGYRDLVLSCESKARILIEDIALLNKCDECWIFCSKGHRADGFHAMPEGIVFEALYASYRLPREKIFFADVDSLFDGQLTLEQITSSQQEMLLDSEVAKELSSRHSFENVEIPAVLYCAHDPLDFKYAEWLRFGPYRKRFVPLVPSLGVRFEDCSAAGCSWEMLVVAWATLFRLADETLVVSPLHEQKFESIWLDLVGTLNSRSGSKDITRMSWEQFDIPKALLRERWPVTEKESRVLRRQQYPSM